MDIGSWVGVVVEVWVGLGWVGVGSVCVIWLCGEREGGGEREREREGEGGKEGGKEGGREGGRERGRERENKSWKPREPVTRLSTFVIHLLPSLRKEILLFHARPSY